MPTSQIKTTLLFLLFLSLLNSCKKTVIEKVEVERRNSWQEIKRFHGTERIFLSSGTNGKYLFFQQPFYFTTLKGADILHDITVYGTGLPTDISVRLPIGAGFFAYPQGDTALIFKSTLQPNTSPGGDFINLKALDHFLTSIQTYYLNLFKCMAINRDNRLLVAYHNKRPDQPHSFFILTVVTSDNYPYVTVVSSRQVLIPRTTVSGYVRYLAAIDDYFLLDLSADGIFKITQDGNFRKVHAPATVDAFYKWQDKVYGHAEWDKTLISDDNGNSFQSFGGLPAFAVTSGYYTVRDSLVGAYRANLFTLRWQGNSYFLRQLKDDGLKGTRIYGVEVLRDSVYVATTGGLFVKPVAEFFKSK
jgi:hypothetical protein